MSEWTRRAGAATMVAAAWLCGGAAQGGEPGAARAPTADAAAAASLSSDGLRCGRRLVSIGDSKLEVRDKCGRPALTESRYESRALPDGRSEWVRIDEWTYRLGKRRFLRVVTFERSRVTDVRAAGYDR